MSLDAVRRLDLYKKVPHDLTKGTLSGALISGLCIGTLLYLMYSELNLYSNGSLKTSVFVSYRNQELDISLRLNMTVLNKACEDIAADLIHSSGQREDIDIHKSQRGDNCNLHGDLNVKRTTGELSIVPHKGKGWTNLEYHLEKDETDKAITETDNDKYNLETDIANKNNYKLPKNFKPPKGYTPPKGYKLISSLKNSAMNHIIHQMSFGNEMRETYRWTEVLSPETKSFDALSGVSRNLPVALCHGYHLRLVATSFVDQNQFRIESYQYSYGYNNYLIATPMGIAPPNIGFKYELSPMEIKYQLYRKPLYHLLTMLCAIVGGVVTVAGVLDKILFNTHQLVRQKMAIGKLS